MVKLYFLKREFLLYGCSFWKKILVSTCEIGSIVKKPHSTVLYIFLNSKTLVKLKDWNSERQIARSIKKDPKISAITIAKKLEVHCKVHPQTVQNFLHSLDFRAYIHTPRNKLHLFKRNIQRDNEFRDSVNFTDYSKLYLFRYDGRQFLA